MGKKSTIDIKTDAVLTSSDKTEQQKRDAEKIEEKKKKAAAEAEQAKEEARIREAERKAREAEEKARKEQLKQEAEAAREKAESEAQKKEELLNSGIALAETAMKTSGKNGGFFKGLLIGVLIGAVGVFLLTRSAPVSTAEQPAPIPAEQADVLIDSDGVLGYTAADFQEAVLGCASEHQELIVMEQPLSITTTITRAGLGSLPIFSKMKEVTYCGTGVYTVDLSGLNEDRILVDEENCTVTIRIPHAVLQYVNTDLSKTQFEDTEQGLLAFGDIKLTAEETNLLERAVHDAMQERLDQAELYEEADRFANLKTWEIFQPLVTAVSPLYKVEIEFLKL